MSIFLSHTAQQILADLQVMLDKEQARQVLVKLQPLIDDRHFKEVSLAIVELMPDEQLQDIVKTAIDRTPAELFEVACMCVTAVTGVSDIHRRRSRRSDEIMSRYYALFIMCEELHTTSQATYRDIGALFTPPIHHTVIIHARKMALGYLESDEEVRRELMNITRLLAQHGHWRSLEKVKSISPLKSKHIEL